MIMLSNDEKSLLELAKTTAGKAYAPYSHFPVGAALLCEDGLIFTGCNVENVSFSLTICAERVALVQAVVSGQRRFRAIAVWASTPSWPCGACRQVLAEFAPAIRVIRGAPDGNIEIKGLDELFPQPFTLK
jgi:cytidine deaminase